MLSLNKDISLSAETGTMGAARLKVPKVTACAKCPWRDRAPFRTFTPEELGFIASFKSGESVQPAGATILVEGQESQQLYTLLTGWAFRYKALPDGRRQILNFAMPGDFLGLQTAMLDTMDHSVEALTDVVLCTFPRQKIWTLYNNHPGLAFDLTWIAAREERLLDENLLSVGRRSAMERLAHILLYVMRRARSLGLTETPTRLRLPFTQQHVADALGLSLVHTNKTLRKLAARGIVSWKDGVLDLADEAALARLAQFDEGKNVLRPLI
jgi:CRP/FNR family transcriptional regulator, anaerobic regulatory protein